MPDRMFALVSTVLVIGCLSPLPGEPYPPPYAPERAEAGAPPSQVVGGTPPCKGSAPATDVILDAQTSGQFTFAGMGLGPPTVTSTAPQTYQVSLRPGRTSDPTQAWVGFGFPFRSCIDASQYAGVRFTITGDLGACRLVFSVVTSEDNSTMSGPEGACTATMCYQPMSGPLAPGTTTVTFAEMTGGMPMDGVDPAALNGIQWTALLPTDETLPPCNANFVVSDVSFVR
jgi:hypothetical protein